tara:strand:+ start:59 stop:535 length:477 start_codon:yes stop_codon:yes gene_type:complete
MRLATHEQQNHLLIWIKRLVMPYEELGGNRVCPYAHLAKMRAVNVQIRDLKELPDIKCDVLILICSEQKLSHNNPLTHNELKEHCARLAEQYPDMIFLPDSEKETHINGVQTNNGKYKLILCQSKQKLLGARTQLAKTDYYTFWEPEYLKEIVGDSLD